MENIRTNLADAYLYFKDEMELIKTRDIEDFVSGFIQSKTPKYFWEVPASSTGKYHPEFSLGEGGLYRHTRAAVKVASELFQIYNFHQVEKDIIVASLLLHDMFKSGTQMEYEENPYTAHNHPLICATTIITHRKFIYYPNNIMEERDVEWWVYRISDCVASHMGQWSVDSKNYKGTSKVQKLPETELEKFVHLCDYLASRRGINIDLPDYQPKVEVESTKEKVTENESIEES